MRHHKPLTLLLLGHFFLIAETGKEAITKGNATQIDIETQHSHCQIQNSFISGSFASESLALKLFHACLTLSQQNTWENDLVCMSQGATRYLSPGETSLL